MSSAPTPDAHAYPLLIKQLLLMPLAACGDPKPCPWDCTRMRGN